jgi:effector-binding domain-containing protein
MKTTTPVVYCCTLVLAMIFFIACSNSADKNAVPKKDSTSTAIKKAQPPSPEVKSVRPPIVNIVDTVAPKRLICYFKDSAKTFERISLKLGKIYGVKLADYMKKNGLKASGAPMAWYKTQTPPYFFEAGMPINKTGKKSVPGVQVREIAAGKVIVAHFYGPYELLPQGYDAIKEFIKENKKIAAGIPYEMYVTDPIDKNGKPVDPYKVQTDIIFPIK